MGTLQSGGGAVCSGTRLRRGRLQPRAPSPPGSRLRPQAAHRRPGAVWRWPAQRNQLSLPPPAPPARRPARPPPPPASRCRCRTSWRRRRPVQRPPRPPGPGPGPGGQRGCSGGAWRRVLGGREEVWQLGAWGRRSDGAECALRAQLRPFYARERASDRLCRAPSPACRSWWAPGPPLTAGSWAAFAGTTGPHRDAPAAYQAQNTLINVANACQGMAGRGGGRAEAVPAAAPPEAAWFEMCGGVRAWHGSGAPHLSGGMQ